MRAIAWLKFLLVPAVLGQYQYGTFDTPSNSARVKFRYWLPDASVDVHTVQDDIRSAGEIGIGGVEFLPLYNYGGSLAPPPNGSDWATYGFGTEAFCELFRASLRTAKEEGLLMDFALGPNQGQGVPAVTTDEGLHWDLVCSTVYMYGCLHDMYGWMLMNRHRLIPVSRRGRTLGQFRDGVRVN